MNRIESIDIDDKQDYELAKFLSKKYLKFKNDIQNCWKR